MAPTTEKKKAAPGLSQIKARMAIEEQLDTPAPLKVGEDLFRSDAGQKLVGMSRLPPKDIGQLRGGKGQRTKPDKDDSDEKD